MRRALVATLCLAALAGARAQDGAAVPHRDPGLPSQAALDAARAERRTAQAAGPAALDTRVAAQLRASFDAADRAGRGLLTRAEAQAGGFGYVARHFDEIDTRGAGAVSFADLTRYLQSHDGRYLAR